MKQVPCDTTMRAILDLVDPQEVCPLCKAIFRALQCGKAQEEMVCVQGYYLVARDGPGYFPSQLFYCASCRKRHRTRLQGEWRSVASFSGEPGEMRWTALEEAGDGIDQGAKGRLAPLAAGLTQR